MFSKIYSFLGGCLELFVNFMGINTQENREASGGIREIDMKDGFEFGVINAMSYLDSFRGDPVPNTLIDVFRPSNAGNTFDTHPLFKFIEENDFDFANPDNSLAFVISTKAVLIPDIVSEFLQQSCHIYTYDLQYTQLLLECQAFLYLFLLLYLTICNFYSLMSFILFINPHRYPYVLITTLAEPLFQASEELIPGIGGFNIGFIVAVSLLTGLMKFIGDIAFTMPYLPSEAVEQTFQNASVYVFSGLPQLWSDFGVPNELRMDWFDKDNFGIMNFYTKMYPYGKHGVTFIPQDLPRVQAMINDNKIDDEIILNALRDIIKYHRSFLTN
jgi:uncharacterized protein YggT (Ycf19 family)